MDGDYMDTGTYEGFIMNTFVEKYRLKTAFVYANGIWARHNKTTNTWEGLVGNVSFTENKNTNF